MRLWVIGVILGVSALAMFVVFWLSTSHSNIYAVSVVNRTSQEQLDEVTIKFGGQIVFQGKVLRGGVSTWSGSYHAVPTEAEISWRDADETQCRVLPLTGVVT